MMPMKPHDTFLELAAIGIDFPLATADRRRLEQHLAACTACGRTVAALHADARAMADLPAVHLPDRRGDAILANALHPPMARHPVRLVLVTALLALLALGSLVVGAELVRRTQDDRDLGVVLPGPTASPAPDATPDPGASPSVPVEALSWEQVGVLPDAGATGLVAFDGGYVAYGTKDGVGPVALFSADGRSWEQTPLGEMHLNCPGWGPAGDDYVPDAEVNTGTTNGSAVLLAGTEQQFTDAACSGQGAIRMVSWVSSDGRSWQRSSSFAPSSFNARASGSWATDEGWHVVDELSGTVWASVDGLQWQQVDISLGAGDGITPGAANDGVTTVANVVRPYVDGASQASRRTSGSWQPLALPDACSAYVGRFHAPEAPGSGPWVLQGSGSDEGDAWSLCVSPDLEQWATATLPTEYPAAIGDLSNTRYGVLASLYCADMSCPTTPEGNSAGPWWQFLSADGRAWTSLGTPLNAQVVVDGPTGVIAIAADGTVHRLVDTRPASEPPAASPAPEPTAGSPGPGAAPLGSTWSEASVEGTAPMGAIAAVTAGGPGFVALGSSCFASELDNHCEAPAWTSVDGRTWTRSPDDTDLNLGADTTTGSPVLGVVDIAAGGPGIVAIGYAAQPDFAATTWFSPDGRSWDRSVLGDPGKVRVNAVTWDGRQFVLVGEDHSRVGEPQNPAIETARAAVWTSGDGRDWTRVPHITVLDVGGIIDPDGYHTGGMADVVAGPAGLVAVGSVAQLEPARLEPAAWTSSDGVTWVRAGGLPDIAGRLTSVAAADSGYAAIGYDGCDAEPSYGGREPCPTLVLTSPEGVTWTQQPFDEGGVLVTITRVGERYLATGLPGPETLWTSADGAAWTAARLEGGPPTVLESPWGIWRFAATDDTAVWLGPTTEMYGGPHGAWVSATR